MPSDIVNSDDAESKPARVIEGAAMAGADRFTEQMKIRLPLALKLKIEGAARVGRRSMNAQVVVFLEEAIHRREYMPITWQSLPVEESDIPYSVITRLERVHPGRFVTMGDLAAVADEEYLAMPGVGADSLVHIRSAVTAATEKASN